MEYLDIAASSIQELFLNPSLSNVITFVISFLLTFFSLRKGRAYEFKVETYKNFISPLFHKIEPNLYHNASRAAALSLIDFIEANHKYTNGKLKEYAFFCKNNPNEANYKKLCWYIDFLYDQYCFALSIKIRSAYYRIKRKQYINLLHYILLFVLFILSYFRTPLVTWISIYLLLSIANSYGKHIELFLLLILIVLIRAFIQLLWDSLTGYHSAKDDRMLP